MRREPESRQLMDEEAQARAYAESDFATPHNRFVDLFQRVNPTFERGNVLDIGCGNGDPTIRFANRYPRAIVVGIDGSGPMIDLANAAAIEKKINDRVYFQKYMLDDLPYEDYFFDAMISNSLLHHLDDPAELWSAVRLVKPGGPIFVMDLARPATYGDALNMVKEHDGDPELMKQDFLASLKAAYRPEEVWTQLEDIGLGKFHVETVSNRHMIIHGTR